MRDKDLEIALRFAPIICQETAGDENQRYQDYFCRADYDGNLQANDNWNNLDQYMDNLRAEIYFSLVETASHYFILYSVYHPRDWKVLYKHENDMEHAQVVVKKRGKYGTVQFLCTNAHHSYYVYHNPDAVSLPENWKRTQYSGTALLQKGRPVIFVQPGNGFNQFGGVGHGIVGLVGGLKRRWDPEQAAFSFAGKQGLVCFPAEGNQGEIPDRRQLVQKVKYGLVPTEQSLWKWKDLVGDTGIFGENILTWEADNDKYVDPNKGEQLATRKESLSQAGAQTRIRYPKSFNGNEGKEDEGKAPFAFQLGVPLVNYWKMRGSTDEFIEELRRANRTIDYTTKEHDNFFDPAHAWFLRLGGQGISTTYTYQPYLGIGHAE